MRVFIVFFMSHTHMNTIDSHQGFMRWRKTIFQFQRDDTPIALKLSELSEDENRRFSDAINRSTRECGCSMGSIFMIVSCIGWIILYFLTGGTFAHISLRGIFALFMLMVIASLAGKVFGLILARYELFRTARIIAEKMIHHSSEDKLLFS